MENSVEKSDSFRVLKRPRSDLQSIYAEKSRFSEAAGRAENGILSLEGRGVKRARGSSPRKEWNTNKQSRKIRKGKKEALLSSFKPIEHSRKENGGDFKSGSDTSKLELKFSGFVLKEKKLKTKKNESVPVQVDSQQNALNSIANSLENNTVLAIPKRPRGFSGRKKLEINHVSKQPVSSGSKRVTSLVSSSSKSSSEFHRNELTGDSKRKKVVKENSSDRINSISTVRSEDGPVQFSGVSITKGVHSKIRKKQKSATEKQTCESTVEKTARTCEDLQEDEEENLEQNAARMLSSRFDPNCTVFSDKVTASTSQSANVSLFSPLFHRYLKRSVASASDGSADRALRPRNRRNQKGFVRKRRHFYELSAGNIDPYLAVDRRVKVYWPLDQSWYFGLVKEYNPVTKLHHIKYDDRDEEWINLQSERFKLLLLPSEKSSLNGKTRDEDRGVNAPDENCTDGFTESEPIISWLVRSNHRAKYSSLGAVKKQHRSGVRKTVLSETGLASNECLEASSSKTDGTELSARSVVPERSAIGEVAENSTVACSYSRKITLVYYRRRFRKAGLGSRSEHESLVRDLTGSLPFHASSLMGNAEVLEEVNIRHQKSAEKDFRCLVKESILWHGDDLALLKLSVLPTKSKQVKLVLRLPLSWFLYFLFDAEKFWLCSTFLLHRYGTLVTSWPKIYLEMLFVDNLAGLRFLLFEGCLRQAVAFVCLILAVFCRPSENEKVVDMQLPVTSIRFKISSFQDLDRELIFVFYNFLELRSSKWVYLDNKLKRHCVITKELPLSECTYANVKTFQGEQEQIPVATFSGDVVLSEAPQRRPRDSGAHWDCSSRGFGEGLGRLPPFVLSFAAAPTFFLSLHLKLLMDKNVASIGFQNQDEASLPEDSENYFRSIGDDSSLVYDSLDQVSESALALRCGRLKVDTNALSISNGDWPSPFKKSSVDGQFDTNGTYIDKQDLGKNSCACYVGSWGYSGPRSWSSVAGIQSSPDKSEAVCLSCLNRAPQTGQVEESSPFDRETLTAQQSAIDLTDTIHSPNPTAPRSVWHRNRPGSFGFQSKLWHDGRSDLIRKGIANGSSSPQTQVSHFLPFGSYSFGSRPRSYHRRGRPYKRLRNDDVKMRSDRSESPQRQLESLFCDANVLVIVGDRGWRLHGAQVVLECADHKDWRLVVKSLGVTKYSHKAHQFLQPGTINRYTHAMMWKGGKDWILEFTDRTQWNLFKDMHEECYNRNIQAASVKNIPIPGVRLIDDSDDNMVEVPFVRSSSKYYRQVGTEVEMALDPSCVVYDLESDDEEWISKLKDSSDAEGNMIPELSEEMFEKAVDMFEKVAYAQQQDSFTTDEIEQFMVGFGQMDVIKAIHEHWHQKRKRKGMALIRQFQPALWECYQQQLIDWELAMSKIHVLMNGFKNKELQKPPMFAFCLRPRGLEVPNKGSKHRSQRKLSVTGHYGPFSRDQDGIHAVGRKLNGFSTGEEKGSVSYQNHESDASPSHQTSTKLSPRDISCIRFLSTTSSGSERSLYPKIHRRKAKKIGMFVPHADSATVGEMSYNQRTTGNRNGVPRWNTGISDWPTLKQPYQPNGFQKHRADQMGGLDYDEFRLRDASSAAQHATNMAKLKREKAQRLLHRAEVALHKAVVALMTAEAIEASEKDLISDG